MSTIIRRGKYAYELFLSNKGLRVERLAPARKEVLKDWDVEGDVDVKRLFAGLHPGRSSGTVSAPSLEPIRIGTTNAAGTGSYDSGGTWTDGIYTLGAGSVTVTGGIGVFDGAQSAGTYTVGGRDVVVDSKYYACANQSEWAARVSGASLDGWTIIIREGAGITTMDSTTYTAFYQVDVNCTISGDGQPDVDTTTYHMNDVSLNNTSNLLLKNLAFKSLSITSNSAGGWMDHLYMEDCVFGSNLHDVTTEPAAGYFTGLLDPFRVMGDNTEYVRGLAAVRCVFRGSGANFVDGSKLKASKYIYFLGCHVTRYYDVGVSFVGINDPVCVIGGNLWTNVWGTSSDTNYTASPNDIRLFGLDNPGVVLEANMHDPGNGRGQNNANVWIEETGKNHDLVMRACGMLSKGFAGLIGNDLQNAVFDRIAALPYSEYVGTVGSNLARLTLGAPSGTTELKNSFGGLSTVNAGITQTGNVDIQSYTNTSLTTALAGWATSINRPTWAQVYAKFAQVTGQALENKGPGGMITAGLTADQYVVDTSIAPQPILSAGSVTPTTTSFTATITTDTPRGFLVWVVVPSSQTINPDDWLDVVLERVNTKHTQTSTGSAYLGNALEYGTSALSAAGTHTISGSATLASGSYNLVVFHINGWGVRSVPSTLAFTISSGSLATITDLLPNATHRVKRDAIVAAHFPATPPAGFEGNFKGITDTTGFTTKTITSADNLATELNNAGPTDKLVLECAWNGNSQSAQRIFGYSSSGLTANASVDWGYDRPVGAILIRPAAGYSPIYESTYGGGVIDMIGFSKLHIENMVFENPSIWFTSNSYYPCIGMIALLNNTFQNSVGSAASTYGAVKFTGIRTLHAAGNKFTDVDAGFIGGANYLRSWDNEFKGMADNDIHGFRGLSSSYQSTWVMHIWVAGAVLYAHSSRNSTSGLHPDFLQIGNSSDVHVGYEVLGEMNVFHLDRGGSMQGTQGFFGSDGADSTGTVGLWDGDWLVHNNIGMISAYHACSMYDPKDNKDKVSTKNMFLRSATPNDTQDSYPWIQGSRVSTGTGTLDVDDNYAAAYNTGNVSGETYTSNDVVDPRTSAVSPNRYQDVITGNGTFTTNPTTGYLQYTSPDASATDAAAAKTAIVNFAKPLAGWSVNSGPEDPATWPTGDYALL